MPRTRIIIRRRPPSTCTSHKLVTTQPSPLPSPPQRALKSTPDSSSNHQKHIDLRRRDQRSQHFDNVRVYQQLSNLIIRPHKATINSDTIASRSLDTVNDTSPLPLNKCTKLTGNRPLSCDNLRSNKKHNVKDTHYRFTPEKDSASTDGRDSSRSLYGCGQLTSLGERKCAGFGSRTLHGSKVYLHKSLKTSYTAFGKSGIGDTRKGASVAGQDGRVSHRGEQIRDLPRISHLGCADREDIFCHRWVNASDTSGVLCERKDTFVHRCDISSDIEYIPSDSENILSDSEDILSHRKDIFVHRCDISGNREDITSDRCGIHSDREDIPSGRGNILRERQDICNDFHNICREGGNILRDREDFHCDIVDILNNRGDIFSDRQDIRSDREDIGSDREDIGSDRHDSEHYREGVLGLYFRSDSLDIICSDIEEDFSSDKEDIQNSSIGLHIVNVLLEPLNKTVSNSICPVVSKTTVLETDVKIEDTDVYTPCSPFAENEVFSIRRACCNSPETEHSCCLVSDVLRLQCCSPSVCDCVGELKEEVAPCRVKTSRDGSQSKPVISGEHRAVGGESPDQNSLFQSSGLKIEASTSHLESTPTLTDNSGMTSSFRNEMADMTFSTSHSPSKRKKRRRSKRAPAATRDSLFLRSNEDTSSDETIYRHSSHTNDDLTEASEFAGSSIDETTISKISSVDRLRLCSSPSFIYDPEIAAHIPFYFKNPEVDELFLEPNSPLSGVLVGDEGSGDDTSDDDSSEVSWAESDNDCLNDDVDRASAEDDLTTSSDSGGAYHTTRSSTSFDEAVSSRSTAVSIDSSLEESEIDYDSYLPAHVLMHVKRDLVSVLMEYGQTREVKVSFQDMERSGPHHASRFHTAAIVDSETFPVGSGSSKKNAKKAAAAQALKIMYDRGRKNLEVVNEVAHKKLRAMSDEEVGSHAHRVVLVSRHVLDTAEETQFINYSKDKIAATFVLEYHSRMRVVGLGTGNRCMLYQHLTLDGKRIIHSHAEIIARRAFIRYLYKQLLTFNGNRSHPIFTRSDTGKLKLRDKIQVHLYISRPPCGDAAAFPTISNFPNKMRAIRKQGQLRTIIDDGEGAIPTDFPVPAGANGKERLRIMTCSDKICRWNVLGVQGAMLSHFLDPIYISSLVIGSHTGDQRGHVPRAVSGRLKCGRLHEVIQRPYHINTPDIHYPHDDLADNYNITKSKQYCITWSFGDVDAEVIDAITGVTNMESMEDVIPSRVSKITLYGLFQQVCNKYGQHDLACLDYLKAKRAATTFQRMKSFVGQHLAAMGFGQWYSLQDTYGTDSLTCPGPC